MKVDRREFFKIASAAGLVIPSWSMIPIAQAQSNVYAGRILINIHANGGIDQSSWTDPRATDATINNYAAAGTAVVQVGNIRMAPMGNNAAFLQAHGARMLVINGVHSETNGHDEGTRSQATGKVDMGYPNVAELFASVHGQGLPFPWLNAGGFATSVGLAAPTPMPSANALAALASPNFASANNDFMKQADLDKALLARGERVRALQARGDMIPRANRVGNQFNDSDESRALLKRVAAFIPATFDNNFTQAHAGLIAAQAGIASTIQLSTGGFDGHAGLAGGYANALPRLTDLIDYVWQKSTALGISNRIMVRVYSEFGRTVLNNGNGKDHWAAGGTMVLMEAAPAWGNRVVGATGPRHQSVMINPSSGAVVASGGVVIKPAHVHDALRQYLGIQTTDPRFNLKVPANERIDFFNPSVSTGYPNA